MVILGFGSNMNYMRSFIREELYGLEVTGHGG
jgi:hypothetical protein